MAMVTVTDRAAEELRKALVDASPETDQTLRLRALPEGDLALSLDQRREDDEVVQSGGTDILVVAAGLLEAFGEVTIDWRETAEGGQFVVSRSR